MEEAYRGVMGGYAVLKDGDTRHSPTHAVIDLDEYYELVDDITHKKVLKRCYYDITS